VDRLHDICLYALRYLKVSSDRMKVRYDSLANSAKFQEEHQVCVCVCRTTRSSEKLPKLQAIQGDYPDQRCNIQDQATSESEDAGGTFEQTGTISVDEQP
jgi:hypothetical protein